MRPLGPTMPDRRFAVLLSVIEGFGASEMAPLGAFSTGVTKPVQDTEQRRKASLPLYCESSRTTFASAESSVQGYPISRFPMTFGVLEVDFLL